MMSDLGAIVREALGLFSRLAPIKDTTPLSDLGLDGLDWLELEIEIEDRAQRDFDGFEWEPFEDPESNRTVGDLIAALRTSTEKGTPNG